LISGVVEQIVDQLKRDAEVESVLAKRGLALGAHASEHAADLRAAAKEKRGFSADDFEVLVLGNIDVAGLGELIQLAFNHSQCDVAQHADDLE
jgi:hypothetical protein